MQLKLLMELNEIAKAWIEMWDIDLENPARNKYNWVDDFEFDAVYYNPELAIDLVLEILKLNPKNEIFEVLAAGPLEQILANHGDSVIERKSGKGNRGTQYYFPSRFIQVGY